MYGTATITDLKKDLKHWEHLRTEPRCDFSLENSQILAVWMLATKLPNSDLSILLGSPCRKRGEAKGQRAAQYQAKGCSRKMPPSFCYFLMGSFARTLFLEHCCRDQFSVIQGNFCTQMFSNTSFGRTFLGSNFGGLLLEQTFCRHFAAFPKGNRRKSGQKRLQKKGDKLFFSKGDRNRQQMTYRLLPPPLIARHIAVWILVGRCFPPGFAAATGPKTSTKTKKNNIHTEIS